MSSTPPFYIGYIDGMNQSSQNVASLAWVIFNPSNEFLDFGGIFLGRATNNLVEYEAIIALMTNASTLGICSLVVRLDFELVISQLTSRYDVLHPMLYRKYLRVHSWNNHLILMLMSIFLEH
jgi:ribonuclease HI